MARTLIGRVVRRLRSERALSQQALATRLGISPSYLNLIEHDQRAVTASLLIKLAETLRVDLGALSGAQERQLELGLREAFSDPLLGADAVPEAEIAAMAGASSNAARAVLARYRAWRVGCPRGHQRDRITVGPARVATERRSPRPLRRTRQPFPVARSPDCGRIGSRAGAERSRPEMNHAIAERLRRNLHGARVYVKALEGPLHAIRSRCQRLALRRRYPEKAAVSWHFNSR